MNKPQSAEVVADWVATIEVLDWGVPLNHPCSRDPLQSLPESSAPLVSFAEAPRLAAVSK